MMTPPLDDLLAEIRSTSKYAHVSDALIRRIGTRELAVRRKFKDAVQETRNKLHQIGGLYQPGRMRYGEWFERIAAESPPHDALRDAMAHHASTRERLPILDSFYARLFDGLPPTHSFWADPPVEWTSRRIYAGADAPTDFAFKGLHV